MERTKEGKLVPAQVQRKEQEEIKELNLEDLDMTGSELLKTYKNREIPKRWNAE